MDRLSHGATDRGATECVLCALWGFLEATSKRWSYVLACSQWFITPVSSFSSTSASINKLTNTEKRTRESRTATFCVCTNNILLSWQIDVPPTALLWSLRQQQSNWPQWSQPSTCFCSNACGIQAQPWSGLAVFHQSQNTVKCVFVHKHPSRKVSPLKV